MEKKSNIPTFFLIIFFALFAFGAKAATIDFPNPTTISNISEVVVSIVNWLLGITGALAILFLVYGGVVYVTSWGDDKNMEQGKKIVTYAVLGLFIVLVSYSIVITLNNIIFG